MQPNLCNIKHLWFCIVIKIVWTLFLGFKNNSIKNLLSRYLSLLNIKQTLWDYSSSLTGSLQQKTFIYSAHSLISNSILLIPHTVLVLALTWRDVLMKHLRREKFKDILCTVMLGLLYAFKHFRTSVIPAFIVIPKPGKHFRLQFYF